MPDATTLWDVRETRIAAGAFDRLGEKLEKAIKDAGSIPPRRSPDRRCFAARDFPLLRLGRQIIDASLLAAPGQPYTQEEKDAIKAGRTAERDLAGSAGQGGAEGHRRAPSAAG